MALTQVRARIGTEWVTLTYNDATGRYEGTLTPPGTSIHQPGGYYSVEVEATNDSGDTASISGTQLASLRLVVQETTAPVVTLVSPVPGYLTTGTSAFVFDAVDEAGGSGIDPDSFSVNQAGAVTWAAISGGYRFMWTPSVPWTDGVHMVAASVKDYDGNESTVSGAYIVDTVPPELLLCKPSLRHVVDDESVTVAGEVWDVTTPDVTVTVAGKAVPVVGGKFEAVVPLAVGENTIPVIAADGAGLTSSAELYMIRLVTDRAEADIAALAALMEKPLDTWTTEELAWFNEAVQRGAYNDEDLNRVGVAVRYLSGELERRGYIADTAPKTDWVQTDAPTVGQMAAYLVDVKTVCAAQGLEMPSILETMRRLTVGGANQIEAALVAVDAVFPRYTAWSSNEVTCGGV